MTKRKRPNKVYVLEANFQWPEQTGSITGWFMFGSTFTMVDHWSEVAQFYTKELAEKRAWRKEFAFGDEAVDTRIIERKLDKDDVIEKDNEFYLVGWASPIDSS